MRAKYTFDKKQHCIDITEIPYTTTVEAIVEKIVDLVKASKIKNPIKEVGALPSFGADDPLVFESEKIKFSGEKEMTPEEKINELQGFEKAFFKKMFAGSFAKKLYKIYTFKA